MREYPIFTQRIAGQLMAAGIKLIRTAPNRNVRRFKVFYFEDTPELKEVLGKLN